MNDEIKPLYEGEVLEVALKKHYIEVTEKLPEFLSSKQSTMTYALNKDGNYIGSINDVETLINKFGITHFEKRIPEANVCSIGYNPIENKWYGWSHRAISSFETKKEAQDFAERVS